MIGKRNRAFSYLFVLSLLSVFFIFLEEAHPLFSRIEKERKEKYFFFVLREYAMACYKYKSYYGRYPISLSQLRSLPPAPTFLRRFYRDPFAVKGKTFVDNTNYGWNLVKVPGRRGGIIGVRSRSQEESLSGVPYSVLYYDKDFKLKGKPERSKSDE